MTISKATKPAVNARGKRAGFMIGLRRSFWPMIGTDAGRVLPANYLANALKETFHSMTSLLPPRDWTDIHWPGISETLPARWIAVLPLAATEQHGPHLPVGTDIMIAQAYLARVREVLPDNIPATFLPLQPVGISTEHIDYPGTLTLPTEIALQSWMALGTSVARAGIKKLVMVTSHGGNSAAMSLSLIH